jgi:hypothetical protein
MPPRAASEYQDLMADSFATDAQGQSSRQQQELSCSIDFFNWQKLFH